VPAKRTLPDPEPRACVGCGKVFTPIRKKWRQRYCEVGCQRLNSLDHSQEHCAKIARQSREIRGEKQRYGGEGKSYVKYLGRHLHRVIMERKLGRPLKRGEVVHHIDGDIRNNDPSNLMLMNSQGDHCREHFCKNRRCELEGCDLKHKCRGMCAKHYQAWRKRTKGGDAQ
jgi:hypothetical protein